MDQETRNKLQRATQQVRRILEEEFAEQLEGTFDILPDGKILPEAGKHLDARQRLTRQKLVDAIEHIKAGGKRAQEAVDEYTREAAFTFLNRFVALRMLEARGLLQECVSKGDQSSGFKEFCGLAPGLSALPDDGYRLYLECLFDELSVEVKVLFDRRDSASLLWPRRGALAELLDILGQPDLAGVWSEDETIGWVYQYFNSGEERKKMREESQAPRNSRELAVRNQFFTPRYVVEFLTDNTLGRIWYEMRQGQTRLVDECRYLVRRPSEVILEEGQEPPADDSDDEQDLSQEELLKKTVYIPHRAKKDPRDLKILDPACGSGHFLLYAFDLLISIYDEAWHDETSPPALEVKGPDGESPAKRLRDDYAELEQLHAALPGLVLAHNLHGIDIDPRAAQIAALALWMRGQRAFNEFQIAREQRPAIARSNIVCAEPMPGEAAFLDEFIAEHLSNDAEGKFLASLVRKVFEAMKLAGEAGSLLKIEEDIAGEVAKAKKQWLERPQLMQQTLFADGPSVVQKELNLTRGITDETFWGEAEQRIYNALHAYSEQAERSGGFQRRLFAVDAACGFALIDVCRQRYDVALMNPPFGAASLGGKRQFENSYPNTKNDIYAAFVERGVQLLLNKGLLGAITSRTGFFLSSFQKWREDVLLTQSRPVVFADLGHGIMDGAMVEAAAFCMEKGLQHLESDTVFLRLIEADDKDAMLRTIAKDRDGTYGKQRFEVNPNAFTSVPRSPFAYWVSETFRSCFKNNRTSSIIAKSGLKTDDDFRFVRLSWEVEIGVDSWVPFSKGGAYSPFYSDVYLVLNWKRNGLELKGLATQRWGNAGKRIFNERFFFRPGLAWPLRTTSGLSVRPMPKGCVFAHIGPAAFVKGDNHDHLMALAAVMSSSVFLAMVEIQLAAADAAARSYEVGLIQNSPIPELSSEDIKVLCELARRAWSIKQQLDTRTESSHAFCLPAAVQSRCESLAASAKAWSAVTRSAESELATIQAKVDDRCFALYGVTESDRRFILAGFRDDSSTVHETAGGRDLDQNASSPAVALISWAVGVGFGRFNVALARCVDPPQFQAGPFGQLPICSPGMLSGRDGLPASERPDDYPFSFPEAGILVDDPGHTEDVTNAIRSVFDVVFAENADKWWQECSTKLAENTQGVRAWCKQALFTYHVKCYSESRRKAPIYWQLATPSASYSIWLYYHRFTKDTFFKVLNEYVKPKLDHERQKLERVRSEGGAEPTRSQRKEIEDQEKFVDELASMAEEVERIAPLWNPNLNDGVIINFAPLWRLVPQNKSWQKECKKVWDKLVAGDYDWAHLAMHLWPERVVPKCVTDASLAIAHGLEDTFWQQDDRDRFQPLKEPEGGWGPVIKKLVEERTSPAVKAALNSLMEAPAPASSTRTRRRRAAAT